MGTVCINTIITQLIQYKRYSNENERNIKQGDVTYGNKIEWGLELRNSENFTKFKKIFNQPFEILKNPHTHPRPVPFQLSHPHQRYPEPSRVQRRTEPRICARFRLPFPRPYSNEFSLSNSVLQQDGRRVPSVDRKPSEILVKIF